MGLVLHRQQGTEAGTDEWFHNPVAQASAHFGIPKVGIPDQWMDTVDKAWAEIAGNARWLSAELEGYVGEPLTPNQIYWAAQIFAWGHNLYGYALQLTSSPSVQGLGYHSMGGPAWGHLECPGAIVINARPQIVSMARGNIAVVIPMPGGTVYYDPPIIMEPVVSSWTPPEGGVLQLAGSGAIYAWGGAQFRGCPHGQDYFVNRVAHHIEAPDEKEAAAHKTYVVIDTANERYAY